MPSLSRRCFLTVFLFAGLAACSSWAAADTAYVPFRADLPAGAGYRIDARALHPTQFSVGFREVVAKARVIDAKDAAGLRAYLQDKDVPVVIGPGGVPYMTDGHHTIRALIESRQADKTVYGHILANWSALEPTVFWERMRAANNTYLKDASGRGPLDPKELPTTLLQMQSDPYRGLAWGVMEAGGFKEKKGFFFQEFFWADYFRSRVTWDDAHDDEFARAVQEAVALARQPAAAQLPGFRNGDDK